MNTQMDRNETAQPPDVPQGPQGFCNRQLTRERSLRVEYQAYPQSNRRLNQNRKLSLYVKYILVESGRPLRTSQGPCSWVSPQNPLVTSAEIRCSSWVVGQIEVYIPAKKVCSPGNSATWDLSAKHLAPSTGYKVTIKLALWHTARRGQWASVYNITIPVQYSKPFGKGARIEKIKK